MKKQLKIDRSKLWTLTEFEKLGEEFSCQVIDGVLYDAPTPLLMHQKTLGNLLSLLYPFDKEGIATVLLGPLDIHIDNTNILKADLMIVSKDRSFIMKEKGIYGAPDIIVEIISRYAAFLDRYPKKRLYQNIGVTEYWIVDPANETLEIYSGREWETPILHLASEGEVTSGVLKELKFGLKEIFNP